MAFQHILVPLDGSPLAECAVSHAVRLAGTFGADVTLLRVLEALPALAEACAGSIDWRLRKLEAQAYLAGLAKRFAADGIETECRVSEGRAADEIVSFARTYAVDLNVLSAYGWGGDSLFPFGGTVQKLLSTRGLSCLVSRPVPAPATETPAYRRILVPLDGSPRAEWAANIALGMARQDDAELVLLQVVPVPDMPRRVTPSREELELRDKFVECNRRAATQYLAELSGRLPPDIRVRTRLEVAARVVPAIRTLAEEEAADLIVLTGHGNAGPHDMIHGSICNALLSYADRPVLVLRDQQGDVAAANPPSRHWAARKLHAMS